MQEMKYFIPNETFDNAIKNKEKGVLKALLIGIIGSDPTFSTTEYDEAIEYIKTKSVKLCGSELNLSESYCKQEDEYTRMKENWDEDYYRMLLVWYRDNYATERLTDIKMVGKEVFKNKSTLGKYKRNNRLMDQRKAAQNNSDKTQPLKKEPVVTAAGNDVRNIRLPIVEWFKKNWKWVVLVVGAIAVIATIICLLSNKGFSKNQDTSRFSYMTSISGKASNRSNTGCITKFDNTVYERSHRKNAVKDAFRSSLKKGGTNSWQGKI